MILKSQNYLIYLNIITKIELDYLVIKFKDLVTNLITTLKIYYSCVISIFLIIFKMINYF